MAILNFCIKHKIANLISKLNFSKLIPYLMDNSLFGRRRPTRQMSEDLVCPLDRVLTNKNLFYLLNLEFDCVNAS